MMFLSKPPNTFTYGQSSGTAVEPMPQMQPSFSELRIEAIEDFCLHWICAHRNMTVGPLRKTFVYNKLEIKQQEANWEL